MGQTTGILYSLRALGRREPPAALLLFGRTYHRRTVFKHDFFAATSLYESDGDAMVVKIGRRMDFLGLPLAWMGRWATAHEVSLYNRLAGVPGLPGRVVRLGPDVFAHEFVPGHTLRRGEVLPAPFFSQLESLLGAIHGRDVAYVDLEKRENILVGEDGRPYLIDFQISLHIAPGSGPLRRIGRWLLRRFQQSDRYHLLKHWRRHRPDQLSDDQIRGSRRRPFWVEIHRWIARPLTRFRRQTLQRVGRQLPPAGDEARQVAGGP